jgi:tricorn protease
MHSMLRRLSWAASLLWIAIVIFGALPASAAAASDLGPIERPLWLRYPAISPDGTQIAFAFEGNLFVVPAAGGTARALTANGHHNFMPVWSPDGKYLAYAADTYGNFDVFLISSAGGPARRLTYNSNPEYPTDFTPDGKNVVFWGHRMDARTNVQFPQPKYMPELYQVSVEEGRRPVQILTTPALAARYNEAGDKLLYEDLKGYENLWRKHHQSPVAHDIWVYDVKSGQHTKLTDFPGEDRNPVWGPDQQTVYYLSERSGSFNVWKFPLAAPAENTQVTKFERNPVRFLSISRAGELCFGYDGEIYTLAADAAGPVRVPIHIAVDTQPAAVESVTMTKGATEMALSPNGKEIAFVVRGEVYVASTEFGTTRRITNTPEQERSVDFSPDGRHLVFAGEHGDSWNLYEASLSGTPEDQPYFFDASAVTIKTLLQNGHENFQPKYSPDGKEVAYLEDRTTLKVLNLASGATRTVLPGEDNYSYADGDQWFQWSPDAKWFLVTFLDRNRWSNEVGLIDAAGKGPLENLTKSGYEDNRPQWATNGTSMIWTSDRMGLHGDGSGGNPQTDVYAMFFTQAAFDRFNLSKPEYEILKEQEDRAKEKKEGDSGKPAAETAKGKEAKGAEAAAKASSDEIKLPPPLQIDLTNIEDRKARLTLNSSLLEGAALTPDGETLLYLSKTADGFDLWLGKPRDKETRRIASFPGDDEDSDAPPVRLLLDHEGKTAYVLAGGGLYQLAVPAEGMAKTKPVALKAEMNLNRAAERAYIFEHVWRQTKEKFYLKDMNGVDWDYYRQVYARFLPYITDNWDFAEMLSEMVGELDASHTGSGYTPHNPGADATAALGVFYNPDYAGAGVKVDEIIEDGPLTIAKSKIAPGMIIEQIDGHAIAPGAEFDSLLNHRAGKPTLLSVYDPAKNRRFEETVKPISLAAENELLYKRWVKHNREEVDRLSGGRLGYVHVRSMDDKSYRNTFSELLGRDSGKEAVIVDTRFNGGGNLHDELATLLSGKAYLQFLPRGQSLGWEPTGKWTKPSVVLISESNYSDAHLFPWVYRHLGIGKLIGMPVAGTGTAVWWETQQDDTLYYGIPMVGFRDQQGEFMEKALIKPDLQVPDDPAKVARGEDQQLEAAVAFLLGPEARPRP